MATDDDTLLIAFDGSAASRHAVDEAGRLFPGRRARVITVWLSIKPSAGAARAALPEAVVTDAVRKLDEAAEQDAAHTAATGAELARTAGLDASPEAVCADTSVWRTIVHLAEDRGAPAVVVGSRTKAGARRALLGSTSTAVVQHCRRPVVVVHPQE